MLHKTVIGWLKYGEDWALVRQASDRQDAGRLVCPVGGHVQSGESDVDALKREAFEEIGVSNLKQKHVGQSVYRRQVLGRDENHLFIVFEIFTEEAINLGNEAVAIERFTEEELKAKIADNPNDFGASFYFVLENFYPSLLPKGYANKYK